MLSNKPHLLLVFLMLTLVYSGMAQEVVVDSAKRDTLNRTQLPKVVADSIVQDSIPEEEPLLLDKIRYTASDSIKLSKKDHKIYLYNNAELYYQDTELKSGIIVLDYVTNEVYAGRIRNSEGELEQLPYFKQGSNEILPDSIRFNFGTQKALIWNSRSDQGGLGGENMNLLADYTKKENDSVFFLKDIKLTSSQTPEDPDYYIRIKKAKFVPKKKMIAGFSNLYIADIPTPVALPFAYFPMTSGRSAGLIMPSFGNDPNKGYFLQNIGYYLPINQYADIYATGDVYANGSWGFRTQSVYTRKYKYSGNLNFRYENLVVSQKGFDDYSRSAIYNIQFSHSQDSKASPTSRFSASVNLGSSSYFRNSLNQNNLPNTQNNNLSSSISYSKSFPEYPRVDLSLTASHNQNTNTQEINLTLPTFQGSLERIYPFAKREGTKKGIIQNFNTQWSVRGENSINTTDSLFFTSAMFKDARLGMQHSLPFGTNFKLAKYISVSVGGSYTDNWVMKTYGRSILDGNVVRDTLNGFARYGVYGLSASLGTTVYGTFAFKEGKKIQAIRHVIRPSMSIGYTPAFDQYYEEYLDPSGQIVKYSKFEGSYYGAPGLNSSKSLSFQVQNSFEAKVNKLVQKRIDNRDTLVSEVKKVKIIDNLNFSSSYALEADSLRLQPVNFSGSTKLFRDELSLNFSGIMDPYDIDDNGTRINELMVSKGGLFRLTRASLNLTYGLSNDSFGKKKREAEEKKKEEEEKLAEEEEEAYMMNAASGGRKDNMFGRPNPNANGSRDQSSNNEADRIAFYENKIPWNLNLSYALTYSNMTRQHDFNNNSLMFSGDVRLTPKWGVGFSSGYDFKNKGFTLTQFTIDRTLKDFTLNFDWTPFGKYERWYFFIGIKSSLLSDLKWEKQSRR